MMACGIGVVVGNPRVGSRTLEAALTVARELTQQAEPDLVVDLAEYGGRLLDWSDTGCTQLVEQVSRQKLVVFASPTFKATYSGLLKVFLDRFAAGSLDGLVAIPLMVGAAKEHALAVETHLKPLLAELGAACPTRGLFLSEQEIDTSTPQLSTALQRWLEVANRQLRAVAPELVVRARD
jgi:FMN reductase